MRLTCTAPQEQQIAEALHQACPWSSLTAAPATRVANEACLYCADCKALLTAKQAFTALQEQREAEALHQAMEHLILEAYSQLGKGSVDQAIQLLLEGG